MSKNTKIQRGFSFIEMIVVMAIILIMTTVLLVVAWGDRENKELQAAGRVVAATLRETQNNALTGKTFVDNSTGDTRFSCYFSFVPNANGYHVEYAYHTGTSCADNTTEAVQPYVLEGGVAVDTGTSFNDLTFTVPFASIYVDTYTPGTSVQIVTTEKIVLKKKDKTYNICIFPSGSIEERGFQDC